MNRGELLSYPLSLDEGLLLGADVDPNPLIRNVVPERLPYRKLTAALELKPGRADLIEGSDKSLVRRDAVTGEIVWDALRPGTLLEPKVAVRWLHELSSDDVQKTLLASAPDLDGDGVGDLIWSFPENPAILVISGKDGSLVWTYVIEAAMAPAWPESPLQYNVAVYDGQILGVPELADVNRDGTADLVVTAVFPETAEERERRSRGKAGNAPAAEMLSLGRRIVTAISGKSGRGCGRTRSTVSSPNSSSQAGIVRPPSRAGPGPTRCWLSPARSASPLMRRRAARGRGRSTWVSSQCARSKMRISTATANLTCWRLGPEHPARKPWPHFRASLAGRFGPNRSAARTSRRTNPVLRRIGPCSSISTATVEVKSWFQTRGPCQPGVPLRASGLSTAQPAASDGRGL